MISQARPHADNSFEPENKEDMVFEQIPMGYLDKVIGKDQIERFESSQEGEAEAYLSKHYRDALKQK